MSEGVHMISLVAALLSDLKNSPAGAVAINDPDLIKAMRAMPDLLNRAKANPLSK